MPSTEAGDHYSNPLPPSHIHEDDDDDDGAGALTNDDFRRLLMTPRDAPGFAPPSRPKLQLPKEYDEIDDAASRRRKKKNYYAKLRKQEEEREKELAKKYRDRARERREGHNPDYQHVDPASTSKTTEYRAVAPTADAMNSAAERRRLAIQESKFLGGDMEHTHLVKGLDFALLQKVRSEIATIESEQPETESKDKKEAVKDEIHFTTGIARKIYNTAFNTKPPEKNELFHPGRMAYVFDVEEDAESDLPTTLIRSKADCPTFESQTTVTTNDIVINKLTQILSYLRHGVRANKKQKKKDKGKSGPKPIMDDSIYGEIGDYEPEINRIGVHKKGKKAAKITTTTTITPTAETTAATYFDRPKDVEEEKQQTKTETSVNDFIKSVTEKYGSTGDSASWTEDPKSQIEGTAPTVGSATVGTKKKSTVNYIPDSYAECYPGAIEMVDAAGDSDDEADYSKMDMGNKKGPVGRWDFDTEEEYNVYMEQREAMPKAAFQFGIKMSDGRKTRTKGGHLTEKQKLDREWQKISQIISKRKTPIPSGDTEAKRRKDE